MTARLADIVAALDGLYPPSTAETWDAVGLVCGDPAAAVERVLLAVDPVEDVAQEAVEGGYQLLVTHHPLYLGGTTSVAADDPKGRVVHQLITGGCGLFVAHTNADKAAGGVNDALAGLFGLRDTSPLEPDVEQLDKLVVFVPINAARQVRLVVTAAGAGQLGAYDSCTWSSTGIGTFRPLPGAQPAVGTVGELASLEEVRLEVLLPRAARGPVLRALHEAHPYEQPAYDLLVRADQDAGTGLGRVGDLPEAMTLADLTRIAAQRLPATVMGVRASGDPASVVRRLAVCGGAGDSLMAAARASGAQAFLTSDLRHHRTAEAPEGLALLDAAHWATEAPWLDVAAAALAKVVGVATAVSALRTDPWTTAARSPTA